MYYDSILDGVSSLYFDSELKIYGAFFFYALDTYTEVVGQFLV